MNIFVHAYPKGRDALKEVPLAFAGSLADAVSVGHAPDLVIGEPPLYDFKTDTTDDLTWAFDLLATYSVLASRVVIPLPYSYVIGPGRGYVLELQGAAAEGGFTSFLFKVRHNQYGACVAGTSAFLLLTKEKYVPPKSVSLRETTVSQVLPDVITIAPKYLEKVVFVAGSGGLHGFMKSTENPFPQVSSWGPALLMCERKDGATLSLGRLTPADLRTVFGVEAAQQDLPSLRKLVPNPVYDTFYRKYLA